MDAIAIDVLSRLESKQYAGIPLCESPLSTDQARMLRRSSESNRAIVAVPTEKEGRRRAIGALLELATVFDRVRILHLPPEPGMPIDPQSTLGEKEIREYLASSKSATGPRNSLKDVGADHTSLEPEDPSPSP